MRTLEELRQKFSYITYLRQWPSPSWEQDLLGEWIRSVEGHPFRWKQSWDDFWDGCPIDDWWMDYVDGTDEEGFLLIHQVLIFKKSNGEYTVQVHLPEEAFRYVYQKKRVEDYDVYDFDNARVATQGDFSTLKAAKRFAERQLPLVARAVREGEKERRIEEVCFALDGQEAR